MSNEYCQYISNVIKKEIYIISTISFLQLLTDILQQIGKIIRSNV